MYEPTEREILIEMLKTLNKIEDRLTWLLGIVGGIVVVVAIRFL